MFDVIIAFVAVIITILFLPTTKYTNPFYWRERSVREMYKLFKR
jgi:hypothetical protein